MSFFFTSFAVLFALVVAIHLIHPISTKLLGNFFFYKNVVCRLVSGPKSIKYNLYMAYIAAIKFEHEKWSFKRDGYYYMFYKKGKDGKYVSLHLDMAICFINVEEAYIITVDNKEDALKPIHRYSTNAVKNRNIHFLTRFTGNDFLLKCALNNMCVKYKKEQEKIIKQKQKEAETNKMEALHNEGTSLLKYIITGED